MYRNNILTTYVTFLIFTLLNSMMLVKATNIFMKYSLKQ